LTRSAAIAYLLASTLFNFTDDEAASTDAALTGSSASGESARASSLGVTEISRSVEQTC
jgi:hypothetical protein